LCFKNKFLKPSTNPSSQQKNVSSACRRDDYNSI
jgi:hypothetical protein